MSKRETLTESFHKAWSAQHDVNGDDLDIAIDAAMDQTEGYA